MKITLKVSNITCANCAQTITSYFKDEHDILARVHVPSKRVSFSKDNAFTQDFVVHALQVIGYQAIVSSDDAIKQQKKDRLDLIIGTILTLPLLLTMVHHLGLPIRIPMFLMNGYVQWILTTPIFFFVGRRFFYQAYFQFKSRNLGMDSLVVIGTSAAYILSIYETVFGQGMNLYFETTAVIIWMVLIGNTFENRVKAKTSDALFSLMALESKEARVLKDGLDVMLPIQQVTKDMIVRVFANESIPVDGIILKGKSYIDEQMLTGESMPIVKTEGDVVYGATLNMMETIEIRVTKTGSETMLQQIIETVLETAALKPPIQKVADKIAAVFVPIVIVLSILTFISWQFLFNASIDFSISAAIAVLVISCPCALGLATPTSISVGSGIAFKNSILYKGGSFFEEAKHLNYLAFDKTGTLTKGQPEVKEVVGDVLEIAASLEYHTKHPLAEGILKAFGKKPVEATNVVLNIGFGMEGDIDGIHYYIGSETYMTSLKLTHNYEVSDLLKTGHTVIFVGSQTEVLGYIVLHDPLKDDAKALIVQLKSQGLEPVMITGDHKQTAAYVAEALGIQTFYAQVLPHQKADIIKTLQDEGHHVGFVGDGINDGPALKIANVGFAVKSGHDVAIDASDVTLLKHDMHLVMDAINLSKATLLNIKLNFLWAFGYNVILIPVAAIGLLNPSLAGIGMAFSSILVVLNALSLHLYKFKKE